DPGMWTIASPIRPRRVIVAAIAGAGFSLLLDRVPAHAVQTSASLSVSPSNWGLLATGDQFDVTVSAHNTSTDTPAATFPDGSGPVRATLSGRITVQLACTDPACTMQLPGKLMFVPVGGSGCVAKNPAVTSCASAGGDNVAIAIGGAIVLPAGGSVDIATI